MKYKNLENGFIYTPTGITENKTVMGKEFTLMQCKSSDGKCYLVPVQRFDNLNYFEKVNPLPPSQQKKYNQLWEGTGND